MRVARSVAVAVAVLIAGVLAPPALADQGSADGTQPVLATSWTTTCAIRESSLVYCWGANGSGQLGRGTQTTTQAVAPVSGLSKAIGVYGGQDSLCALLDSHKVSCWGAGHNGVLGRGSTDIATTPVAVTGLDHVATMSVGINDACAVRQDGTVWCWGGGVDGILGTLGGPDVYVPTRLGALSAVTAVAVGNHHACALKVNHTVWCWGGDSAYELGNGAPSAASGKPVQVKGLTDAVAITAGDQATCAIRATGGATCWGENPIYQLGYGGLATVVKDPVSVWRLAKATQIDMGIFGACAIAAKETMCWGYGAGYGLGDTSPYDQPAPVLASVAQAGGRGISIGTTVACQVTSGRSVICWGENASGSAGDGTTNNARYGTGPGNAFGRAATVTKVPILNPAPGKPSGSSKAKKQVSLTWTAPSTATGTSAPTDYVVQYRLKGATAWSTYKDAVSSAKSVTVKNLTSGKSYSFRVVPKNWAGTGAASTASADIKVK